MTRGFWEVRVYQKPTMTPRYFGSAGVGDNTVGAVFVATSNDGDMRFDFVVAFGVEIIEFELEVVVGADRVFAAGENFIEDVVEIVDVVGAQDEIDVGDFLNKRVSFLALAMQPVTPMMGLCGRCLPTRLIFPRAFLSARSRMEQVLKRSRSAVLSSPMLRMVEMSEAIVLGSPQKPE